jgi:stage II sporulation protein D
MKGYYWWLSLILWVATIAPAQASIILRVSIERGVDRVRVGSSTKAIVRDYTTYRPIGEIAGMNAFYAQPGVGSVVLDRMQSGAMWVEPTGNGYIFIGDRWYRGKALIVPTDKGLTAVNFVDLEQYLYSVVGAEVFDNWPLEALKAQAVAARTYALYERQNAKNGFYDLGDTPYWQAYRGIETEASTTHAAVDTTAGQVVTYKGQIIEAQFHNCAGGHTENVEDVWGNYVPYLRGVSSDDRDVSECQWTRIFSAAELNQRLSGVGNILQLMPEPTAYNSIKAMTVVGDRGKRRMTGEVFKDALGLKSQRFYMTPIPTGGLRLEGLGWGHGVGMSQWGAHHMAVRGYKYWQILGYYYQNTALGKIQPQRGV